MNWKKTTPRQTRSPSIPEIARTPEAIDQALRATKEVVEIGLGRRGDPMDRFATLRDLSDGGIANVQVGPGGAVIIQAPPGTGAPIRDGDNNDPDYGDEDYTRPPKPENVRARSIPPDLDVETAASLGNIMITWDSPGYHNHWYTEIYRMPHGAQPSDPAGGGVPMFNIESELISPDRAHGAMLDNGTPNQLRAGSQAVFVGVATGTIFMDRDLAPIDNMVPGGTDLDNALNPGSYHYWARFVSRARVTGPVSDRASGTLSINPTLVLDLMTRNVTDSSIFRNLREWLAMGSPEAQQGGSILEHMETIVEENLVQSIWSVRMRHDANGLVWTAGFGLALDTRRDPDGDWESVSTFLVNANQFAIMGSNAVGGGAAITNWSGSGSSLTLRLASSNHGFSVQSPRQRAVLMVPTGDIRTGDPENPAITTIPSQYTRHAGVELEVVSVSGNTVTLTADLDERHPQNQTVPSFSGGGGAIPSSWGFALMPGQNIPFIVDTARNVVGIRGTLVVDGLVRATEAEFNELRAGSAFVDHLTAEVVNANLVIGQKIIAGVPDHSGPISGGELAGVSNYIVELNNPAAHPYPMRIYKPYNPVTGQSNHSIFDVTDQGDLYVGGHLTVRKAATIRGQPQENGGVLFSTGGSGWDTGANDNYALWIGPESGYGASGEQRRETNAIMWVKSSGRAGFNADVFLGGDPLRLPSGNGYITVKPRRDGGSARVFVSCAFSLTSSEELQNCWLGADLYLVPVSYSGPGNPTISRVGYDPSQSFVNAHSGWYGSQAPTMPSGAKRVCGVQVDSRGKSSDIKSRSMQGSVLMPAGDYKIFLAVWQKGGINGSAPHGCFAVHPFAVQVSNDPDAEAMGMEASPSPPGTNSQEDGVLANEDGGTIEAHALSDAPHGSFVTLTADIHGRTMFSLAEATPGMEAHGYILQDAFEGDRATIHTDGINSKLSGLAAGETYVLDPSAAGSVVEISEALFATGNIRQVIGVAVSESALDVNIGEPIERK